ncbi:MAG: TIR domain-containing protein [Acidobacteria bacterium]|nr:TIR domain-containing protein [Acidobacteriota bacterium]
MSVEVLAPPAVAAENPFPGLRPFEEHESEYFFGREGDLSELLIRLRHMRFLAVVGASGCGKSSLIRAGLIASLKAGGLPGMWRVAVLRPWQSPVAQLALALSDPEALDVPAESPEEAAAIVKAILRKGPLGIVEAFHRYPLGERERLLILVDQFEELFTFVRDVGTAAASDEARAFVKLLIEALSPEYRGLPIYVALTMRSDHLGECALYPGLAEAINNGLYLLPRMERDQLRDVIKGPVEAAGGSISERLADTLINDLKEDADHLPILQHAMMRLWNQWRHDGGAKIDFDHYKKMGELSNTLCKHAEEVYAELDPERQQPIAEAVFRNITRVKEGKVVRRQTRLGVVRRSPKLREVPFGEIERVLDAFRAEGRSFLVPPLKEGPDDGKQRLDDETAIDISHESLIRQWGRLNEWAMQEATSREQHKRITQLASDWARRERAPDFLIWGANLFELSDWAKNNPDALTELENEFLVTSQDAYEKEQLELKPKKEAAEKLAADGAAQAHSIKKGSAKVFLAYARKDRAFAERLREAFREAGEEMLIDWDILAASDFEDQVAAAIAAADTFVFVLSPASAQSSFCLQELRHAARQHKRVVPVVIRKIEEWKLPEELKKEHWIRFDDGSDFKSSFEQLREAIKSDLVWVQAHTRLLVRATDWETRGRDTNLLLRGHDLTEAKQWMGKGELEPTLTPLQREYIVTSDENSAKRQKQKYALIYTSLVVAIFLLLVAAAGFYWADHQRRIAGQQTERAKKEEKKATLQSQEAEKQRTLADEQRLKAEQNAAAAMARQLEADNARKELVSALAKAESQRVEAEKARQAEVVANQRLKKRNELTEAFISKPTIEIAKMIFLGKTLRDLDEVKLNRNLGKLSIGFTKLGYDDTGKAVYGLFMDEDGLIRGSDPKEDAKVLNDIAAEFEKQGLRAQAAGLRERAHKLLAGAAKDENKKNEEK